ncbi:MAG: carboxypeptidase regulatory-like domain-containing protein [Planctomycetota bacterium]
MANRSTSSVFVVLAFVALGAAGWLFFSSSSGGSAPSTPVAGPGADAPPELEVSSLAAGSAADASEDVGAGGADTGARTVVQGAAAAMQFRLTGRLLDAQRQPVADVEVGLTKENREFAGGLPVEIDRGPTSITDTSLPDRVRSRTDGRFELTLPSGRAGRLLVLGDAWYLRETSAGPATELRVSGLTGDRDLGDLVLGRTASLAGVVEDASGKRVGGVRVAVRTDAGNGLGFAFAGGGVETAADGTFVERGLRPGDYTVTTASPDHLPARVGVTLAEGEERRDFVVVVTAGRQIAGIVVDDLGVPLAGMKVAADRGRELAPGVHLQATSSSEAALTDASGRFALRGLDNATVNVEAWGPGHARARLSGVEAGSSNLVLELQRLGSIAGRLVDEAGVALAGSAVSARPASVVGRFQIPDVPSDRTASTDADGKFVLASVQPGSTVLVATGAHVRVESGPMEVRPGQRLEGVQLVAARGASLLVHVRDGAGQPVAGARVEVSAPPSEPAAHGGVRRAMRFRRDATGGDVVLGGAEVLASATTDDEGDARIEGLRAGLVVAKASHATHAPNQTAPVSIPAAGSVEADLTVLAGGFVQLRVLDAQNAVLAGAPYKLVADAVSGGEPRVETGSCDAGGLALVGPLQPGTWTARLMLPPRPVELGSGMSFVVAGMGGGELAQTDMKLEVVAEKTTEITLTRPQLTKLAGSVRDSKGAVDGAVVELSQDDAFGFGSPYKTTAGSGGRFELDDLPPGDYVLRYGYRDALVLSEIPVHIDPGEALIEKDLLLRTGTLELIVCDEDGEPVAGARVTLDKAGSGDGSRPRRQIRMVAIMRSSDDSESGSTTSISAGSPSATTDTLGAVEIARVPEGKYTVRVEHARYVTTRRADVLVADGATTDLGTLTLGPGGEIRGTVVAADGSDVEFATVEVTPLPTGEARTESAMGGKFRVNGLAAGKYRLRASLPTAPNEIRKASRDVEVELGKGEKRTVELRLQ